MDEQQEFLRVRLERQADRKKFAEEMLQNIEQGWTFQESRGNEDMRDVTAERKAHYEEEIRQADDLSAAYRRWYGDPTA